MSRIGKKPINLPQGVEVKLEDNIVTVKGPRGVLTQKLPADISLSISESEIQVTRPSDAKKHRAYHGLSRALLANMVEGVTKGFEKKLELVGVGYRAQMQGNKLQLNVGFSHPVLVDAPEGIEFEVPAVTRITVKGIDKQLVGTELILGPLENPNPIRVKVLSMKMR